MLAAKARKKRAGSDVNGREHPRRTEKKKSTRKKPRKLSRRMREVLRLVSLGCKTREIAAILGVSYLTAGNHRTMLTKRLGLDGIARLTRYALLQGFTTFDDCLTKAEARRMRDQSQTTRAKRPASRG